MEMILPTPDPPCKNCSRQGCGPYHDECKPYQEWKAMIAEAHKYKPGGEDLADQYLKRERYRKKKVRGDIK